MNIALIVFAGVGSRINSPIPKQFIKIKDKELVSYTIDTFNRSNLIDEIVLVTHKDYEQYVKEMVEKYLKSLLGPRASSRLLLLDCMQGIAMFLVVVGFSYPGF